MRSGSSSSIDATSKSQSLSVFTRLLFVLALVSGCSEPTQKAPPQTLRAIAILGNDASMMVGMQALDAVQSITNVVDRELNSGIADRLDSMLVEFGLDPASESISVYLSLPRLGLNQMPAAVVFAPLTQARMTDLSERFPTMERITDQAFGSTFSWSARENQPAVFISLIEDGLLLVAPDETTLLTMHGRAHREIDDNQNSIELEFPAASPLIDQVSQGQFWIASDAVVDLLRKLPDVNSIPELDVLKKAVASAGISFRLEDSESDDPAVSVIAFMSPSTDVEIKDLVNLINGLIAIVRVQTESLPTVETVLDHVKVSHHSDVARIAFRLQASDIRSLLSSIRSAGTDASR
jgi:hypothetical protein